MCKKGTVKSIITKGNPMPKNRNGKLIIAQPVPMRKQVYEHLREQILNRTIKPSSRLVEAQIAKESGISRTPVREALHLLEKDGFLESIPRVGYRVKTLEWDKLDEIFEIRRVNELLACRWAMQKMDPQQLDILERNLSKARNNLDKAQPDAFLQYDEEFHEILFQAAGSKHLLDICQKLRRLMLRFRAQSIKTRETVQDALDGHERILECLKKKDQEGLEAAMTAHLEYSKEDIRKEAPKDDL
jgi:DNA-binding GntR family transcriptional regulator